MNTNLNIVPLDIAKRLKELNFSYYCDYYYDKDENLIKSNDYIDWNLEDDLISAPQAFIVCQWLSNEHNIDILPCRLSNITVPMLGYTYAIYFEGSIDPITSEDPEESLEYALMKGIDYYVNNVKISGSENG